MLFRAVKAVVWADRVRFAYNAGNWVYLLTSPFVVAGRLPKSRYARILINCANLRSIAAPMNTELGCTNVRRLNYAKYRNFGIRISGKPRQLFRLTARFLTILQAFHCRLFQCAFLLLAVLGRISFLPNDEE